MEGFTNRGFTRGVKSNECIKTVIKIDYVTVLFKFIEPDVLVSYLFPKIKEEFLMTESYINGFTFMYYYSNIFLHFGTKEDETMYMDIKGKGTNFLVENYPDFNWTNFFRNIIEIGDYFSLTSARIKRIDVCIDSFEKDTLTPERAQKWLDRGLITSKFRSSMLIINTNINKNEQLGISVTYGLRKSNISLQIYNKAKERKIEDPINWVRSEFRFKNTWAMKIAYQLIEEPSLFPEYISSILKTYCQYRDPKHERSELKRRRFSPWYMKYLKKVSEAPLVGGNTDV